MDPIITGRNEVVAKVMFLLVSVILSTGVSPAGRALPAGRTPLTRRSPIGKETPLARRPPARRPPWQGDPPGMRPPMSRRTLPQQGEPPPPQQGDPLGRETPRQGDPPARGAPQHMVNDKLFVENCMKMKGIGPWREGYVRSTSH